MKQVEIYLNKRNGWKAITHPMSCDLLVAFIPDQSPLVFKKDDLLATGIWELESGQDEDLLTHRVDNLLTKLEQSIEKKQEFIDRLSPIISKFAEITNLVKEYHNDSELGQKVRKLFN
jgi:hypothetical protein